MLKAGWPTKPDEAVDRGLYTLAEICRLTESCKKPQSISGEISGSENHLIFFPEPEMPIAER